MLMMGVESSCDETAVAIVAGEAPGPGRILADRIADQTALHAAFGGVVPEIAARAHAERLDAVAEAALAEAGVALRDLAGIAVTAGPGLIGGLLSGVMFARGLAAATRLPLLGVNHLAGHALTPRLTDGLAFPYLLLLVSGGHCQVLAVDGAHRFRRLAGTIDDAPGEAFDKVAKLMGLGFPGGPEVERRAASGDPSRFDFPRPMLDRPGAMSFSGLKTAVRRTIDHLAASQGGLCPHDIADLSAGFQAAVAEVLAAKTAEALAATGIPRLAVAGGVGANGAVRKALEAVAHRAGAALVRPPLRLCTDNGAMIAWAGIEQGGTEATTARARWPLDPDAAPLIGGGRRGAKG